MYPVTHATVALTGVGGAEQIWRALRGDKAPAATLDLRFVALGGLVPDLIDKPIAWYLFPGSVPDDHLWGHTLLFPLLLIALGAVLSRQGDLRLLSLGLGCLTHPLVDPVNQYPQTLFWPLLGVDFPDSETHRKAMQITLEASIVAAYGVLFTRRWFRDVVWRLTWTGRVDATTVSSAKRAA